MVAVYAVASFGVNSLNPTKQYEHISSDIKKSVKHVERVNSIYDSKLKECVNFQDSLEFYQRNGLKKYLFNEPSFDDKERIVNSLEELSKE